MAGLQREYEVVVLGATGYTGKYTAEHITTHLPTDLKWAIAGRSEAKLKQLLSDLKTLNSNRSEPDIEVAALDKKDLISLAKRTKVLITTIGPYHKYGSTVFEACAETGTHYLDVTGEVPWVYDMVQKHHQTAKDSGAIMIPQNGIESAPTDLMCWMLASHIRSTLGVGTSEVIHTIHDMKATASGGTLSTLLTLWDSYSLAELGRSQGHWALCPIPPPQQSDSKPFLEKLTGIRNVSDLGTLTDSIQGPTDIPIVGRSWGLHEQGRFYGPKFRLSAYMKARNYLTSFGFHVALVAGFTALMLPPVRWVLKNFVYQPGEGPTKEQVKEEFVEWHAIANADVDDPNDPKRVFGRMRWNGSMYDLTGVCLAQSALVLARERTYANELGGGVLTPSTLGVSYLDKLQKAGLEVEMKTLP